MRDTCTCVCVCACVCVCVCVCMCVREWSVECAEGDTIHVSAQHCVLHCMHLKKTMKAPQVLMPRWRSSFACCKIIGNDQP